LLRGAGTLLFRRINMGDGIMKAGVKGFLFIVWLAVIFCGRAINHFIETGVFNPADLPDVGTIAVALALFGLFWIAEATLKGRRLVWARASLLSLAMLLVMVIGPAISTESHLWDQNLVLALILWVGMVLLLAIGIKLLPELGREA
jgi:hypothetical protein